eukprot:365778-Chlamydomonas_euryale.AAC.5
MLQQDGVWTRAPAGRRVKACRLGSAARSCVSKHARALLVLPPLAALTAPPAHPDSQWVGLVCDMAVVVLYPNMPHKACHVCSNGSMPGAGIAVDIFFRVPRHAHRGLLCSWPLFLGMRVRVPRVCWLEASLGPEGCFTIVTNSSQFSLPEGPGQACGVDVNKCQRPCPPPHSNLNSELSESSNDLRSTKSGKLHK